MTWPHKECKRRAVVDWIASNPGADTFDCSAALGMPYGTVTSIVKELRREGVIAECDVVVPVPGFRSWSHLTRVHIETLWEASDRLHDSDTIARACGIVKNRMGDRLRTLRACGAIERPKLLWTLDEVLARQEVVWSAMEAAGLSRLVAA